MSILAKVLSLVSGDKSPTDQIDPKMIAENQKVLAGMQDLARQLNITNTQDEAMERNLARLKKEGSGL